MESSSKDRPSVRFLVDIEIDLRFTYFVFVGFIEDLEMIGYESSID